MRSVKEWNLVDVERQCLDATLIVSFWILRYNSTAICSVLCRYRCFCDAVSMWFTVLCLENRKCENCRIRGTNLSRQVAVANSFVRWHLISVVSECWTCFMCPFWNLEFWGVTCIFLEIVYLSTQTHLFFCSDTTSFLQMQHARPVTLQACSTSLSGWDTSTAVSTLSYTLAHPESCAVLSEAFCAVRGRVAITWPSAWPLGQMKSVWQTSWTTRSTDVSSGQTDYSNVIFLQIPYSKIWSVSTGNKSHL